MIPREEEHSNRRLHKSGVFKKRNRDFGSWKDIRNTFKSSDDVLKAIFQARWAKTNHGCPACSRPYSTFVKIKDKPGFRCHCGYKVFPLKGTHLEQCRTPLIEILEIIYDLFNHKQGVPSTYVERKTERYYETCLHNQHRIADWMGMCNNSQSFTPGSTIEIDEVFPKAETKLGPYYKFKKGLGSERTFGVLVLVEQDNPETNLNGICKVFRFEKVHFNEPVKIIKSNIRTCDQHTIWTDESSYYSKLRETGYTFHNVVNHKSREYKNETTGCHTNTVEGVNSYIKTIIHEVHKGVTQKYLHLYVNRIAFNMSNKSKTFYQAFDTLLSSLPSLDEKVERTFKIKSRKRNENHFRNAA